MTEILISLISMIGGLGVAYIVNVAGKKVQAKKSEKQPKDRMEQMFDGYERLIKQKDVEDDRKHKYIQTIEEELRLTKEYVGHLEMALEATKDELKESRIENQELRDMLDAMRKEYKIIKQDNQDTVDALKK